jgi:hypothetical protein
MVMMVLSSCSSRSSAKRSEKREDDSLDQRRMTTDQGWTRESALLGSFNEKDTCMLKFLEAFEMRCYPIKLQLFMESCKISNLMPTLTFFLRMPRRMHDNIMIFEASQVDVESMCSFLSLSTISSLISVSFLAE